MKFIFTIILAFFLSFSGYAQESDSFAAANVAYEQGDYLQAISLYQAILNQGLTSKELHYNLGNAYYKNDDLGQAILHYEKAARISPGDEQVQQNLNLAQSDVDFEVLEVPPFFLVRFWRGFHGVFSSTIWVVLQVVLGILFLVGIYLWSMPRYHNRRFAGFKLAALCLFLILLCYLAGASQSQYEQDSKIGILTTATTLLQEPNEGGEVLEELTPGVKVIILDKVDVWYKVSLINKEQGWVRVEGVGLV